MSTTDNPLLRKAIASLAILFISIPTFLIIWASFSFSERELFFKILVFFDAILIFILMSIYIFIFKEFDQWSSKQRKISYTFALFLGFLIYAFSYPLLPVQIRYRKEINTCERIIALIEDYRAKNGHYPAENDGTMFGNDAILFDESSPYRYSNSTNNGITDHSVSFVHGFDDHCDYDLDQKKWDFRSCESM